MALANTAWILAAEGNRVLAIDWDLEAPGLHRYFRPFLQDPELAGSKGLIDLFWEYSDLILSPREDWPSGVEDPKIFADPHRYIIPLEWPLGGIKGCVHFLAAGLQDAAYGSKVRDFDWRAFYERLGGNAFVDSFRERLKYDFVLIDSRTGVADTSGICTLQLPDQVVLCFTYNRQSIKGAEAVADSITARGRRTIELILVATRVEKSVNAIGKARDFARECLDRFLPSNWSADEREAYWGNCETAYYPDYAFEETIAMFREIGTQRAGPFADMNWIATRVLGTGSIRPPRVSAEMRERYLRRIAFRDPRRADIDELLRQWSPSAGDSRIRALISDALKAGDYDADYCTALADAAQTVASRLREIGQISPALGLATDAVELQRKVVTYPIEPGIGALAQSLIALSVYLSAAGRRAEAVAASREAVDLHRSVASSAPHGLPNLALSLINLAAGLSALDQTSEALRATEEAVAIHRDLVRAEPEAFTPVLAQSLDNLAITLSELDRREDALKAAEEAVALRRGLAHAKPEAFTPYLAESLNNLANRLSGLGKREDALTAAEEAVAIYRELVRTGPEAFTPALAQSLNILGIGRSQLGRHEEALTAAEEAVALRRELARARPEAFTASLAESLDNLGNSLSGLGRREEALNATEEAVAIYRGLMRSRPEAFTPILTQSLDNLRIRLSQLGRSAEALTTTQEATALRGGPTSVTPVRPPNRNHRAAIVFVHGFTGSGVLTWSDLSPRIAGDLRLPSWDSWTITFGTSWLPDVCGIWSADADLDILAGRLATDLGLGALQRYETLVLLAHSMGGLVVQKALVDSPRIAARTHAVILFGTPSAGLVKARTLKFWKRQLADMAKDGPFITGLRADWTRRFATMPFAFLAVAGERDQFVPPESSLGPFPADQHAVVVGNHVTMIHPPQSDQNVVDLIAQRITQKGAAGNVGDSALLAIELGEFRSLVGEYRPHTKELDSRALIRLAIALDALGRRDDAYELLADHGELNSDVLGTLAGRLKRKWLFSGRRKADAAAAEAHYARGYALSKEQNSFRQAYYHGINLAFLAFVFRADRDGARRYAREVLDICRQCRTSDGADEWLDATEGEAQLTLGNAEAAFAAYKRFVAAGNDPWKVGSTYLNARTIAADLADRNLARELGKIFEDPQP